MLLGAMGPAHVSLFSYEVIVKLRDVVGMLAIFFNNLFMRVVQERGVLRGL